MEQFDQLLTCCICLDRYRTPKLLPCQHSYCMEPCMEGLVDYVKRQVKCPECRAEHRIPYNGIQGFPTNYTLQKFLELHSEITGELPDPNADAIMSRCNVCSEKAYVNSCAHCDKKCCDDCREAHCDILKREISRVNNQVKRGWHRLEDCVQQVERNQTQLQQNAVAVIAEIEEIQRRLSNALKERTDFLKGSVEKYLVVESKTLKDLKNNLELELANIQSNADLMEKHMSDDTKWDDNELMDCKDIFIKMMDFIRNYDPGTEEYTRRIRFSTHDAVNDVAKRLLEMGDLKIYDPKPKEDAIDDIPLRSSGLSRSKSDHRLVAEFRRREEADRSPPSRRRFGESRYSREENKSRTNFGRYNADDDDDDVGGRTGGGGRFRSRFLRPDDDDDVGGSGGGGNRNSMYDDGSGGTGGDGKRKIERIKVLDTEDASRGPLSGCIRLADSSRVIQRLKEMEMAKIKPIKKKEEPPPIPKFVPLKPNPALLNAPVRGEPGATGGGPSVAKDEIDKIKQQQQQQENKTTAPAAAPVTAAAAAPTAPTTTAAPSLVNRYAGTPAATSPQRQESTESSSSSEASSEEEEDENKEEEVEEDDDEYEYYDYDDDEEEDEAEDAPAQTPAPKAPAPAPATPVAPERKTSFTTPPTPSSRVTTPLTSSSYSSRTAVASTTSPTSTAAQTTTTPAADTRTVRAYGGARTMPNINAVSQASQESNDDDIDLTSSITSRYRRLRDDSDSFVNKYLAKSRNASVDNTESRTNTSNTGTTAADPSSSTRKVPGESGYSASRSRYAALRDRKSRVARSKSSAIVGHSRPGLDDGDADDNDDGEEDEEEDSQQTPFTSRFGRELAKSRSSHYLKTAVQDDSDSGLPSSPAAVTSDDDNLSSWARYLKNKYGRTSSKTINKNERKGDNNNSNNNSNNNKLSTFGGPRGQYLQKQSLLMTFGSRGSQPGLFTWPRGIAVGPDNSIVVADSSNHRVQIFNEQGQHRFSFGCYGNGEGEFDCLAGVAVNRIGQYIIADRYNHRIQIFDPSGHFLRSFGSQGSVDGKFSYPWGITTDALGFIYVCDKENHRVQIFQSDGAFVGKFGVMGSKPGHLEHPHYIAVSSTNRVIVSDSNNHRIQIFDVNGKVLTTFGSEGTDEGQFKFPRGVAVDEQGYIFVADSGNNRIQIFNPDGTFLRCFGRWGQGEGEFKGLEGIAVNSKGNILVADRENHRVQIF